MMGALYKITFRASGKSYIGISAVSAEIRFKAHSHVKNKYPIGKAFRKYGVDDAVLTVLAYCESWELLCLAEQEAIEKFNTKQPYGYNLTDGGEGINGFKHTEEQKKAYSKSQKIRFSNPEERKVLSEKSKLWMSTPEARQAQSEKMKLYYSNLENRTVKRRKSTPEAREAQSKIANLYFSNPENRKAQSERAKLQFSTHEARKALSERVKLQFSTPESRIRQRCAVAVGHAKKAGRPFSYLPKGKAA
jgi:group I intron endonuclease